MVCEVKFEATPKEKNFFRPIDRNNKIVFVKKWDNIPASWWKSSPKQGGLPLKIKGNPRFIHKPSIVEGKTIEEQGQKVKA